jgi:hypothetical protein
VVSVPYLRSEVWYLLPLPSGPRHEIIIKIWHCCSVVQVPTHYFQFGKAWLW